MTRDLANRTARGSRAHSLERFGEALERRFYGTGGLSLVRARTPRTPRAAALERRRPVARARARWSAEAKMGQLRGWSGVIRYSRAGIEIQRPREQPRYPTEFVSPVRAQDGRLAGLVRPSARNATWANVGGPVANGRGGSASPRPSGPRNSMLRERLPKACDLIPKSRDFSVDFGKRHNNEFTERPARVEPVGDDVLKSKAAFVIPIREFPPRASELLRHTIGIGSHAITLHDARSRLPHRTGSHDCAIVKRGRRVVECAFSWSSHTSSPSDRGVCVGTSGPQPSARPN